MKKNTLTACVEKSTNSLEQSGEFWNFYFAHKEYLDRVINKLHVKYSAHVELDDFKSEILYRLNRLQVLQSYKPGKGTTLLNFVIGRIHGYACHIVNEQMTHGYGDVVYSYRNSYSEKEIIAERDDGFGDFEDTHIDAIDKIDLNLKIEKLRGKLTRSQNLLLDQVIQGYNNRDIAKQLGVSSMLIGNRFIKIKEIAEKILK